MDNKEILDVIKKLEEKIDLLLSLNSVSSITVKDREIIVKGNDFSWGNYRYGNPVVFREDSNALDVG